MGNIGYGKIIPPSQIKQRLSEVRPRQVCSAAREFFQPENMSLSLVSPLKTDRGIAKILSDVGYTGYIASEYEGKENPDTAVPKSISLLRKSFNI